jgi:TrmH family RNA methyltransferase
MNQFASLDRVRVVMSHTTHPGNIGACARAMKVMGLSRLYLVNPRHFPHDEAVAMSSGATDVLDAAVLCDSLDAALAGTVAQAALTARRREMALPVRDVRAAATELATVLAGGSHEIALVFGTESSGLTNEEVAMCSLPVTISTSDTYRSLNVAAAAQIMCHELRVAVGAARGGRGDVRCARTRVARRAGKPLCADRTTDARCRLSRPGQSGPCDAAPASPVRPHAGRSRRASLADGCAESHRRHSEEATGIERIGRDGSIA